MNTSHSNVHWNPMLVDPDDNGVYNITTLEPFEDHWHSSSCMHTPEEWRRYTGLWQ